MKRILLSALLITIQLGVSQAQDLSITPNNVTQDTILDFANDPFPEYLSGKIHSSIYNNTNDEVNLRWDIFQITGPSEWEAQLCVNIESGSCYAWGVSTNLDPSTDSLPLLIEANDHSIFDIGVRPNLISGCGTFEIRVSPFDDSTNVEVVGTYHFRFNVDADCNPLVSIENVGKTDFKIFPNPTMDQFTITKNPYVKSVEIFNIMGTPMIRTPFQSGEEIDISIFPKGVYLVNFLDKNGKTLSSNRLVKK